MLLWDADANLYLAGFMASGKTTAAKRLAGMLGMRWIDTDDLVEAFAGMKIPEIFSRYGESRFRELERRAVAEVATQKKIVVSLGGGAVLDSENIAKVKETGVVVCLLPTVDVLWQRLRGKKNRPLLASSSEEEQKEKLISLYNRRAPVYRSVADLLIEPKRERHPTVTVHEIVSWLREKGWIKLLG